MKLMKYIFEYIWLDMEGNSRSKTKVMMATPLLNTIDKLPEWNYDGSSTGQAETGNSEVILRPIKMVSDPFRKLDNAYLVLCETYKPDGTPLESNSRHHAVNLFNINTLHMEPMFGLEQEFFISRRTAGQLVPVAFPDNQSVPAPQGDYYCGVGGSNVYGRGLIEQMLQKLVYADIPITGLNAEVAPAQWEFQVCSIGVDAADSLVLLRYICNRVLEQHQLYMDISAKPVQGDWNGSGCHINYSTNLMRGEGGFKYIETAIKNLSKNHPLHIRHYGDDNGKRLTGKHETSSMDDFSYSVAGRHTSIRIPSTTKANKCGYFEDRRPSSSLDPYKCTALLHATSLGLEQKVWT
jgi:glutamine synthetase